MAKLSKRAEKPSDRFYYFDYLRIITIFAVVILHVTATKWDKVDVRSLQWTIFNISDSLTRWAVPVFVMISGALFLGRDIPLKRLYRHNVLRLVIALVFWSVVYALWSLFSSSAHLTSEGFIMKIIKGHYHLWFLFMIICLYLVVPLLSRMVKDRQAAVYFMVLAFIFAFVVPQAVELIALGYQPLADALRTVIKNSHMELVMGYSGYFVLGYLLHTSDLTRWRPLIYALGVFGLAATFLGTMFLSYSTGVASQLFYGYITVNVCLMSTAVFTLVKTCLNRQPKSKGARRFLLYCSKCSFGVYLVHILILEVLWKYAALTPLSFTPYLSVIALSLLIFVASMAVSMLLNAIPIVKKWLV